MFLGVEEPATAVILATLALTKVELFVTLTFPNSTLDNPGYIFVLDVNVTSCVSAFSPSTVTLQSAAVAEPVPVKFEVFSKIIRYYL